MRVQQCAHPGQILTTAGIGEQSVVTDATKADGQHMQQEAAHEMPEHYRIQVEVRVTVVKSLVGPRQHNGCRRSATSRWTYIGLAE